MLLGTQSRVRLAEARLYVLVTEALCRHSLEGTVSEALAGGAQIVQLREKTLDVRTLLAKAREVRRLTRAAGALFIMNDRPDLARLADADGVHLGQDDLPVQEVRRLLDPEALIGVSTHDLAQVRQAILDGADYLGIGPTFASTTKEFDALAGLDFVRQACLETSLPAFVLGGIALDNVDQVLKAGGRRIAVSQAICAAPDPRQAARALRRKLDETAQPSGS
jgi:thiamine-phosphate pyrophosphorylase